MCKNSLRYYIKELLTIAAPIILGNLGFILIGIGDVIVAGRHSTDTFAAISIATAITNCIVTFGIGLIASISPLLSNYRGENRAVKKYFYPSIRFAMVLATLTACLIFLCIPLISKMGFEDKLVPLIQEYMFITGFSTFGAYLHACLKEFLQSFEIVLFPNLLTIFCVFLNLVLNIVLVFGFGPIPSLGVVGLAIASLIVRYFMGIILLIYCFMKMNLRNYHEKGYYTSLVKIGLPISTAILVEFIAFNSIAIFMGRYSGVYAAAQNLVCSLTTISFMVPFAISNAIAIKVGFANGAKNIVDLKKYSLVGVLMSVGFMVCSALVFLSFPKQIVGIFTVDAELFKIAIPIMAILAVFQTFDGLQIALAGICKGIKQTNIVLVANFVAYWLVSIPLGYLLAFKYNLLLSGFWIGLVTAAVILCAIMIIMLMNYYHKTYKNKNLV
ncbi:MAG: MATE family efflux transporter [Cyanobacteria bacterium SIG26]|nr:MATE family efflux transporter [Cyanobacteria bacterium SIG26]